jgi:hypothetical protein
MTIETNLVELFRSGKRGSRTARSVSDDEAAAEVLECLLLLIGRLRRGKS